MFDGVHFVYYIKTVPEPSHLQACLRRQGERVRTNCAVQRTVALWAKICKDAVKEIKPPITPEFLPEILRQVLDSFKNCIIRNFMLEFFQNFGAGGSILYPPRLADFSSQRFFRTFVISMEEDSVTNINLLFRTPLILDAHGGLLRRCKPRYSFYVVLYGYLGV